MKTSDKTIDILDNIPEDNRPTEMPVIVIERDNKTTAPHNVHRQKQRSGISWLWIALCAVIISLLSLGIYLLWYFNSDNIVYGITLGINDKKNIELLNEPYSPSAAGTTHFSDSILGVAMDFYSLDGLKASIETQIPDTTDKSLVLFMRSADYHPDKSIIGSMVVDGNNLKSKEQEPRLAYLAISADGRAVTGISDSKKLYDHAIDTDGSFFRQYALLCDGTLPKLFNLHGKVERAAIGNMADGKMYYIVTRNKETMYDFADAMREYGFVDAMYMTGGNSYSFYRDNEGTAHVNDNTKKKINKYKDTPPPAPILVFRGTGK